MPVFYGRRASLCSRLAALTETDIPIRQAFELLAKGKSGATARAFEGAVGVIEAGGSLRQALVLTEAFAPHEIELIEAGQNSARLPETFRKLANLNEAAAKRMITFIFSALYPAAILHAAILLPQLSLIFQKGGGLGLYLSTVGANLLIAYSIFGLPVLSFFILRRLPTTAPAVDRLAIRLPVLGSYIRNNELGRSTAILGGLYASGIPISRALDQTVQACQNVVIKEQFARIRDGVDQGLSLAQAFIAVEEMPADLVDAVSTGERSGQLDAMLERSANNLENKAANRLKLLMVLITGALFMVAAAFAIYTIVGFWVGYFDKINEVTRSIR